MEVPARAHEVGFVPPRCERPYGRGVVADGEGYGSVRGRRIENGSVKAPAKVAVGVVMTLFGLLFMFQGLGYVKGSAMTGSNFWAVAGPVIAIGGLLLVAAGLGRLRPRSSRSPR